MKRIMGIDFGDVRTGIAISDTSCTLASGIATLRAPSLKSLIEKIQALAIQYDIGSIVLGHPINMNGTEGPRSEKAKQFASLLTETLSLPVTLFDERCTTMTAYQILNHTNTASSKRKGIIDTLSAEIILQDYLDANKNKLS